MLEAPGDGDGGPEVLDEALVAVDRGGDDGHDVREAVEQAGEEVAAEVGEVREVRVGWVGVLLAAVEEVLAALVDERAVHVAGVSGEPFARLGHEAGGHAVFGAEGLDDVFEEGGAVCHEADVGEFEGGFEDAGAGLGVPAFDRDFESGAIVEDLVVVFLVVDGAGERVAEHAFC